MADACPSCALNVRYRARSIFHEARGLVLSFSLFRSSSLSFCFLLFAFSFVSVLFSFACNLAPLANKQACFRLYFTSVSIVHYGHVKNHTQTRIDAFLPLICFKAMPHRRLLIVHGDRCINIPVHCALLAHAN